MRDSVLKASNSWMSTKAACQESHSTLRMGMMLVSIISASLYALALLGIPQLKCLSANVVLDMAPKAFDDQYIGCEDEMEKQVRSKDLLEKEMNRSSNFKRSWREAASEWEKRVKNNAVPPLPKGFKDEHGIALLAYTGDHIYREFNAAVREGGKSPEHYMQNFTFKVLHFYLTRALKLLRGNCEETCKTVYRGATITFDPPTSSNKTMRFGMFTSTSTTKQEAEKFGTDSFFSLTTCFGVCIQSYSMIPNEKEVLLPVNEVFSVSSFQLQTHFFVLNSTGKTCSNYNCTYLEGPKAKVDTTYKYCSSSAPRGGRLLFSMISPELITGIFLMITAVTPTLVSGV
uniref:NAD(P)(+)--arginine ADP-ribosyltransferase n=1 Tax=Geotrypetes seraphini TaxID=260995 RepID=A0A6P8RLX8_GEOSA|nr:ecto-ADP-ribosyltransferase 5-like isoform X3 [Geotrypetes seraphini]